MKFIVIHWQHPQGQTVYSTHPIETTEQIEIAREAMAKSNVSHALVLDGDPSEALFFVNL